MAEKKQAVAIIGAGISGLIACKFVAQKGFHPVVYEAEDGIGGVWARTINSTKLQNHKSTYEFCDFPWPSSVETDYPSHKQVLDYLHSYALHFDLLRFINFNSRVLGIDYDVDAIGEDTASYSSHLWGGTGLPFAKEPRWILEVQNTKNNTVQVHRAGFVILCMGKYSGMPYIPEFPPNEGPEVFHGKVLHSMDYAAISKTETGGVSACTQLVKGKRIAVVGSLKSAMDIAMECAEANGADNPCTLIVRNSHWLTPCDQAWGVDIGLLYNSRFSELLVHKPGENFLLSAIATLLSPLRWGISKFVESYLRWKLPLKKHGMLPTHSFFVEVSSCQVATIPQNFYKRVEEGSIVLRKSNSFTFSQQGLVIDGDATRPVEADVVILATGYKGNEKLKTIFKSTTFQKYISISPTSIMPLYRQVIQPRIPQLAVIGYAEGISDLFSSDMRCQWLVHVLDGSFKLPSIKEMEDEIRLWEMNMKEYAGEYFWRSCVGINNIWYNDQLCKDMGRKYFRKKGILAELFQPYLPSDYATLSYE
ncbi:unnamed protein product [Citrullus colocynthis]|uniref:Flavin-containing monooxygenase n=1 Tax=Citrullus colocynthis TaxID=252529 RepID=A0ABP0ZAA1_9ROSI